MKISFIQRQRNEEEGDFINDTTDLIANTEKAQKKRTRKSYESDERRERKSSKYVIDIDNSMKI